MKELAYIGWQNYLAQPKGEKGKIMDYKDWLAMLGLVKTPSAQNIRERALRKMQNFMRA